MVFVCLQACPWLNSKLLPTEYKVYLVKCRLHYFGARVVHSYGDWTAIGDGAWARACFLLVEPSGRCSAQVGANCESSVRFSIYCINEIFTYITNIDLKNFPSIYECFWLNVGSFNWIKFNWIACFVGLFPLWI